MGLPCNGVKRVLEEVVKLVPLCGACNFKLRPSRLAR